jgi:hypothetical protein
MTGANIVIDGVSSRLYISFTQSSNLYRAIHFHETTYFHIMLIKLKNKSQDNFISEL